MLALADGVLELDSDGGVVGEVLGSQLGSVEGGKLGI